jgi:RNA-directed DNA polymerase
VNTDELEFALYEAERRVLEIQAKLHRWARDDPHRRFDDLFNLVADPGFLLVAWDRVRGNRGARTAGVDGRTAPSIEMWVGAGEFLDGLRSQVKDGSFRPMPVRERMISQGGPQAAPPGDRDDRRPGDAGISEAGAGAYLRGGLPPVLLRVPAEPPGS